MDEKTKRLRERLVMLIAWSATVAVIAWLGAGFGGGFARMFTADNPFAWLLVASPVIPLVLWLRARSAYRAGL